MTHRVYKVVELVGSSPEGITQAVEAAIEKAAASLRNLRWFEVIETRGQIENGKVRCYQVTLKAVSYTHLLAGAADRASSASITLLPMSAAACRQMRTVCGSRPKIL